MSHSLKLLSLLADGRFRSGESLGRELGLSRGAVWKQIQRLRDLGVECHSVKGKGYCLAAPLELLQPQSILASVDECARNLLPDIEIHQEIHSTNRHLMERLGALQCGHVCLAERQTAGRGRRGRPWVSPFGRNIYLSLYWQYSLSPPELSGLALAVGVAVAEALHTLGVEGAALKWPNDVLWRQRKLAGILLEMSGEAAGPYHVVVGIGLNVRMGAGPADEIDQPWSDITSALGREVSRNQVAGILIGALLQTLERYQREGFQPFRQAWQRYDAYIGQEVSLQSPGETVSGVMRGVDASGALLLETANGLHTFHSGEVSLRPKVVDPCC